MNFTYKTISKRLSNLSDELKKKKKHTEKYSLINNQYDFLFNKLRKQSKVCFNIYIYIYIWRKGRTSPLEVFHFYGYLTHVLPALLKIQAALCLRDRTSNKRPENFRESR